MNGFSIKFNFAELGLVSSESDATLEGWFRFEPPFVECNLFSMLSTNDEVFNLTLNPNSKFKSDTSSTAFWEYIGIQYTYESQSSEMLSMLYKEPINTFSGHIKELEISNRCEVGVKEIKLWRRILPNNKDEQRKSARTRPLHYSKYYTDLLVYYPINEGGGIILTDYGPNSHNMQIYKTEDIIISPEWKLKGLQSTDIDFPFCMEGYFSIFNEKENIFNKNIDCLPNEGNIRSQKSALKLYELNNTSTQQMKISIDLEGVGVNYMVWTLSFWIFVEFTSDSPSNIIISNCKEGDLSLCLQLILNSTHIGLWWDNELVKDYVYVHNIWNYIQIKSKDIIGDHPHIHIYPTTLEITSGDIALTAYRLADLSLFMGDINIDINIDNRPTIGMQRQNKLFHPNLVVYMKLDKIVNGGVFEEVSGAYLNIQGSSSGTLDDLISMEFELNICESGLYPYSLHSPIGCTCKYIYIILYIYIIYIILI